MSLSIPYQVKRMQDEWPRFEVIEQARQFVCWEGPLQPLSQTMTSGSHCFGSGDVVAGATD